MLQSLKKYQRLFKSFFKAKWVWRSPSKCDVLIYDLEGSEYVKKLFNENVSIAVMPIRGESYNIKALIKSFRIIGLYKTDVRLPYIISYIKFSKPKLIITFIDNSRLFYTIFSLVPSTKTALIQNGLRDEVGIDFFESIKLNDIWRVDYMFLFGRELGKIYSKFIEGEVVPVGSIKNNMVPKPKSSKKLNFTKKVAFISQWRPKALDGSFIKIRNSHISHELFYYSESVALSFLNEWCQENGYEFAIIGCARGRHDSEQEKMFYKQIIKSEFSFLPSDKMLGAYDQLTRFNIICSIDSTLGFESLARGIKTAIFSTRGSSIDGCYSFGWPGCYGDSGPFWTNKAEYTEFKKILDYLRDISDVDWENVCSDFMKNIMLYDPGNKIIKEHLCQIIE